MTRHTDWFTPAPHSKTNSTNLELLSSTAQYTDELYGIPSHSPPYPGHTGVTVSGFPTSGLVVQAARIFEAGTDHATYIRRRAAFYQVFLELLTIALLDDYVAHLDSLISRPSYLPTSAAIEWESGVTTEGWPVNGTLLDYTAKLHLNCSAAQWVLAYGDSVRDDHMDVAGSWGVDVSLRRYGDLLSDFPDTGGDFDTPYVERLTGSRYLPAFTGGTELAAVNMTGDAAAYTTWHIDPETLPTSGGSHAGVPIRYFYYGLVPVSDNVDLSVVANDRDWALAAWPDIEQQTLKWQPPRYRWVWDGGLPPLRQYPRDDAAGGAPRQGTANQSISVQSSARQGWTNTYR